MEEAEDGRARHETDSPAERAVSQRPTLRASSR